MPGMNRQITLAARPKGLPRESDFKLVETPLPVPQDGQALVRTLYLSVDPYMRGRMSEAKSYARPVSLGEVMTAFAVGRVVESKVASLAAGDIVAGMWGWQEHSTVGANEVRKLDPGLAPVSTALGVLGMPGMTAYFGLLDICHPQAGETVLISGAAGAVGSLVGQIAKIKGCRAVGIAGGETKVRYLLDELGFDAAFDYKADSNYYGKLKELCPGGIDVYFDNVGGGITDAAMGLINVKARVAVCGQISQYNLEKPEMGPRWLGQLIVKQARVEGFLVFQFADRYEAALGQMAQWLKEGRLKYREQVVEGFENTPRAFIGMLQGENIGKQLVKVGD